MQKTSYDTKSGNTRMAESFERTIKKMSIQKYTVCTSLYTL